MAPAKSYLTQRDGLFFLWGWAEEEVYRSKLRTLDEPEEQI